MSLAPRRRRVGVGHALSACALAIASSDALAQQTWRIEPSIFAQSTLTDNVALTPFDRRGDWVNQITPALMLSEKSAHTTFTGTINLPILLYARTGAENNSIRPEVNLAGTAELYPRLLYVDTSVQVSQQYQSPFGPRPTNLINATNNRVTTHYNRVSPYLTGNAGGDVHYELRTNNDWANGGESIGISDRSYTNEIVGNLTRDPRPLGYGVDYDRSDTRFSGEEPLVTEIGRLNGLWQPDPQWELSADAGYEDDRFPLERVSGTVYGAGVKWRPTDRTKIDAKWEHRFFGGSYHVTFEHRTPLTVWSLLAFRDITTYPQQLASLAGGSDVAALLNSLFASRIPDPAQRQTAVNQLIRDRGLPSVLTGPLSLFSQQVTLQQQIQGTASILGARNSIVFTVYRTRSEPVSGSGFDILQVPLSQIDNTQTGASVVWSYRLTPLYTLATSADWSRAVANDTSGERTQQGTLQVLLSAPISVVTTVFTGVRHQRITSNLEGNIRETELFVGMNHLFR